MSNNVFEPITTVVDWERTLTESWPEPGDAFERRTRLAMGMTPRSLRVMLVVVAAVGGAAVAAFAMPNDDESSAPSVAVVVPATHTDDVLAAQEAPPDRCPSKRDGAVVSGATPDGTGDGADLVMQFQRGYYEARSGEAARSVVAVDAAVPPADVIQRGIDATPVGTWQCLTIVSLTVDHYAVELTEHRPDGVVNVYKQLVTTGLRDGRTVITSIGQG